MITSYDLAQNIGDTVTQNPGLVKVYMKYKVDFCCGGHRSVEMAAIEAGADLKILETEIVETLNRLEVLGESSSKLSDLSNEALIDRILNTHHKYLREELPILSSLLFKLIDVHGKSHPELFEIHKIFNALRTELESHLVKEERRLFPAIIESASGSKIAAIIEELESEHIVAGDAIHKMAEITGHYALPKDACRTYQLTYEKLQHLEADMYQHVHSENNVLFRRF